MKDQVSKLYRPTCKIIVLYVLMLTSANSRRELKKFEINSSKKSTTSVCVLISYILGLNFISRTPSV